LAWFEQIKREGIFMEEFINFLEEYIKNEHQMYISGLSERNVDLFQKKYAEFESKYYENGIVNYNITTPRPSDEEYFQNGKEIIEKAIPRIVFQIKKYDHQEWGILYRCYLSRTSPSKRLEKSYLENFFIIKKVNDYKIISVYTIPIGLRRLRPDLRDWRYSQGKEISDLGKLLEVKKFQPPEDPIQLEEYNAE
jgi:hypothetical protein